MFKIATVGSLFNLLACYLSHRSEVIS